LTQPGKNVDLFPSHSYPIFDSNSVLTIPPFIPDCCGAPNPTSCPSTAMGQQVQSCSPQKPPCPRCCPAAHTSTLALEKSSVPNTAPVSSNVLVLTSLCPASQEDLVLTASPCLRKTIPPCCHESPNAPSIPANLSA